MSGGLTVPEMAPPGALLDYPSRVLSALNAETGGSWFDAGRRGRDPLIWADRSATQRVAETLSPQDPALFDDLAGRPALLLRTGINQGFRVKDALPGPVWSAALIWHPAPEDEETRSLLAMRAEGGANYLHLSQGPDLSTEFRDNQGSAVIHLPSAGRGWQRIILSRAGDALHLWRPFDGFRAQASGLADLPEGADLLIGARSHRRGLAKTLGAGAIAGVFLWPGLDLLSPDPVPQARRLAAGFADYCFWDL